MKRPAVNEIIQDPAAPFQALRAAIKSEMHCSLPGIVHSFDPVTQTATIQPAVRSRVATDAGIENVQLPLLANVPVFFPGGGQYALTMPVQPGDECLVVFADSCIDAWWQSGGVQNQIDLRSHDISDGFAFVGFRSRSKALQDFPETEPSLIGGTLGEPGPAGKSAYELWLQQGYTGTVEDYFESQRGPAGFDGANGATGAYVSAAAFVGNNLVFTLSDSTQVNIPNGKTILTGPAGSDANVNLTNVNNAINKQSITPGSVEFKTEAGWGSGGLLDFHYNGSTLDYTSRIIETNGALTFNADTSLKATGYADVVTGIHYGYSNQWWAQKLNSTITECGISYKASGSDEWAAGVGHWSLGNQFVIGRAASVWLSRLDASGNLVTTGSMSSPRGIFTSETDAATASANNVALITGNPSGTHLEFDGNEIIAKTDGSTAGTLSLNYEGGLVQVGLGGLSVRGNGITLALGTYNQGSWNAPTKGAVTVYTDDTSAQHSAIVGLNASGARRYGIDFLDSTSPVMRLYAGSGYLELNNAGHVSSGGNLISNGSVVSAGGVIEQGNYLVNKYAALSHSHNYAGASSAGGTANMANAMAFAGFGTSCFSTNQTDANIAGRVGWATYLIGNHGNGATYYHQILALDFFGPPVYQRMEGGNQGAWHKMYTDENMKAGWGTPSGGANGDVYHQFV